MTSMETMMKMIEIATRSQRPDQHYVTLSLDYLHLHLHRFLSHAEDQNDMVLLGTEQDDDRFAVQVGCSSAEIARRLKAAWG